MTKLNPWLIALAALLVFSAGVWLGHTAGAVGRARLAADVAREREQLAKEHAKSIAAARTRERQLSQTLADVSERYEKEKRHAQTEHDRLVARLRGDAQQLRRRWLGCANSLPGAPPAAREPDATAIERADSAARIVLAADQCDAQVRALQDLLRAEREERNK